jgi:YgiT-type zinc finger domain-containing protein
MDTRSEDMSNASCTSCGSEDFEARRVEYLYSHDGKYLLVPDTPAEACSGCGTLYYDAKVLKTIERHFFAIQSHQEEPERYLKVPTLAYV